MNLADSKLKLLLAGACCGVIAAVLASMGNPANMAFCIACFIRDMSGALGFHSAAAVQYARPEIIGLILGAFIISMATGEYRSSGGSSPMIRFVLGMVIMIGSLIFLGCPLRMVIRMSAGDLNAWIALIGFAAGAGTGVFWLKRGFSLGRAYEAKKGSGYVLPALMVGVLILLVCTFLLKFSESGPGSKHAPIVVSLIAGLLFGALAQKSRMCFAGGIRDVILMRNFDLLTALGGIFVVMLVYNIAMGKFVLSMNQPGIIAHSDSLWYSRNVRGRICRGPCRRLPAAPADPRGTGLLRFGRHRPGPVLRLRALPQPEACLQRYVRQCGDEGDRGRRRDPERKDRLHHLHHRMLRDRVYELQKAG